MGGAWVVCPCPCPQVRATVVCAPEFEQPDGHLYTYSIRFSLLPEVRRRCVIHPQEVAAVV